MEGATLGQDFVGKSVVAVRYYESRIEFDFSDKTVGFIAISSDTKLIPMIWEEGTSFADLKSWTITLPVYDASSCGE